VRWTGEDLAELKGRLGEYAAMGVQHVVIDPEDRETNDWDRILEGVGRIAGG
jgi:hypothetical protein